MLNHHPNPVEAILASTRMHQLRSTPYGHTQLSQFTCGCGEEFVPSDFARTERSWPTLPALHQALATTRALHLGPGLPTLDEIDEVITGSVFLGNDQKLYRSLDGREKWLGQDGVIRHTAPNDETFFTLIWAPSA